MATTVTMPKLGLTMTEGQVVKWHKNDGEQVDKGQPLVVVMSKKITYELETPASGILRIVVRPKVTQTVGAVLGVILAPGEAMPEILATTTPPVAPVAVAEVVPPAPPAAPEEKTREVRSSPAARRLAKELGVDISRVPGTGLEGRIAEADVQRFYDARFRTIPSGIEATPLARRMAEEEGLDLAQVQGTGPDGRITEDDVLRILESRARPGTEAPAALAKVLPFSGMRQAIAETMVASLHSMAQLTLTAKADVTALVELRELLSKRWNERMTYTDLLVKATALALREHRILNSTLVGEEIVLHDSIHLGVAVVLEQGLIVPVIREADRKSVLEIHRAVQGLAERARAGTLVVDKVTGGTFTLTNLGMYRVDAFTPIVNPPEVAILGVGRIAEELALVNGQVTVRSKMALSLTIDHRVVDGAPGAAFLDTLIQFLEQLALIFAEGGS